MSSPAAADNLIGYLIGHGEIVVCGRHAREAGSLLFQRLGTSRRPCEKCDDTPEQAAARIAEAAEPEAAQRAGEHAAAPSRPTAVASRSGRYDAEERKRARRAGRQRGCLIYIPLEELEKAGIDPEGPPPFYRVWGTARGGVFVRLYKEG